MKAASAKHLPKSNPAKKNPAFRAHIEAIAKRGQEEESDSDDEGPLERYDWLDYEVEMPLPPDRSCIVSYDYSEKCVEQWQNWTDFCVFGWPNAMCEAVDKLQEREGIEWAIPERPEE